MNRKLRNRIVGGLVAVLALTATVVAGGRGGDRSREDPMLSPDTTATRSGWDVNVLLTIGEKTSRRDDDGDYRVPGLLDGLGAFAWSKHVVRVLANHEFGGTAGYEYELANGTKLVGSRVSAFEINRQSRKFVSAGLAFGTIYDRAGHVVTSAAQINEGNGTGGFDRFCSGQGVAEGDFGFEDDVFFAGEEVGESGQASPAAGFGGQEVAVDVANEIAYVVPMLGRAAFENVCPVENFDSDKVLLLVGDDRAGAPLWLYVGEKDSAPALGYAPPAFLKKNGLGNGRIYVWVADGGDEDPDDFHGTGESRGGKFLAVEHYEPLLANTTNHDALGFASLWLQDSRAADAGAFLFSRPEDLTTNPEDGTQIAFASTGRGQLYPSDDWGTAYVVDFDDDELKSLLDEDLDDIDEIPAKISILYDGDDAGDGQFSDSDYGLRSPDNLTWAVDGFIYAQEDRSTKLHTFGGVSGVEASVWRIDPDSGKLVRILEMDRSAVPAGQTDSAPNDLGNWESSGVLDVTRLFKSKPGETILILDVQAHGIQLGSTDLVEGGQLLLATKRGK